MGTLNFVLGPASRDHQAVLLDQMNTTMKAHPADEFFYLVPNHIKFDSEINVLARLSQTRGDQNGDVAAHRLQILSFSRLAWYLLRDTPGFQKQRLSTTGLTMLTRSIVGDLADQLQLFGGEVNQPGFATQLAQSLEELATANIDADDLHQIVEKAIDQEAPGRTWRAKLHDLVLVDREYEKRLAGRFVGNRQLIDLLVAYLSEPRHAKQVSHMHVYIDQFTRFTAAEQQIVCALIEHTASTTISLVLDRSYRGSAVPEANDLFFAAGEQYHELVKFARRHPQTVKLLPDLVADAPRVSEDMVTVEKFMIKTAKEPVASHASLKDPASVQFYTTVDRVAELNFVAGQIRRLVATGRYRYRDFLVLTRKLDRYQTMLAPVFARHHVPVFNDHEKAMGQHPLVTFLAALFEVDHHHFQLSDVMTLLKSGLLVPEGVSVSDFSTAVFLTENWCLQRGITGHQLIDDQAWHYYLPTNMTAAMKAQAATKDHQLMLVKNYLKNTLVPFYDQLSQVKTGRGLATALYQFLTGAGVTDRLYDWQTYQASQGELDRARQPQQVWSAFANILDEYVLIFGDQSINPAEDDSLQRFSELLQTGFAATDYSQVPATLDTVVVSETGIVQNDHHHVVFIIGATDDVMPEVSDTVGLLTDADKDVLNNYLADDQYLAPDSISRLANEPFLNYLGFLSSRGDGGHQQLIFTAPEVSEENKELRLSPYVSDLATYLSKPIKRLPATPDPQATRVATFVSAPEATLSSLIKAQRNALDHHQKLGTGWQLVDSVLTDINGDFANRRDFVLGSLHYDNTPQNLNPEVAERLYTGRADGSVGQTLYASITQLQDFYKNQYEYFLKHGLKLLKRDEFTLSSDRAGVFFHQCLQNFVTRVNHLVADPTDPLHGRIHDLADLADNDNAALLAQLTDQAIADSLASEPDLAALRQSSAQLGFQYRQLSAVVKTMTAVLCQQAARSSARPIAAEEQFGRDQSDTQHVLTPLSYSFQTPRTKRHKRVYLRGRIDRIDRVTRQQLNDAAHDYLTVVDYKSGDKTFDLTDAYHGLALQLLTYLNSLAQNRETIDADDQAAQLGGAVYLHLSNPRFSYRDAKKKGPVERELSEHLYKGILLDQPELLKQLDHNAASGAGQVYALKYSKGRQKKGQPAPEPTIKAKKGALLVTPDQLDWLMAHDRDLIIQAAQQILDGACALNPYRKIEGGNRWTGLDYTDYSDIFYFDNVLDQGKYRDIDAQTAQQALDNAGQDAGSQTGDKKGDDDA